jgi:hypothetical protein
MSTIDLWLPTPKVRSRFVHAQIAVEKLTFFLGTAPDWWYLVLLLVAIGCGIGGIAGWETYTTPSVIFYGLLLCIIFVVPIGIIVAITGIEVTLNVLAEFIGGSLVAGNALAMNFFKCYG